jgi:hypothetical protein
MLMRGRQALSDTARGLFCLATAFVLGAQSAAADPPLTLRGMTFVSSQGSIHRIVVEAATAILYPDTNLVELQGGVHARLEGREGSESLDLLCETGEYDLNTNDFLAVGDVVGRLADGRVFRGPWMRFRADEGLAFSDAPVEITDGAQTLVGQKGLRYWVRDERLQLRGGASVRERP